MASEHETEADYWRTLYEATSARLAEAERDAARYRFIRNVPDWTRFLCVEGADLDRAIDEAARAWDTRAADSAAALPERAPDAPCPQCGGPDAGYGRKYHAQDCAIFADDSATGCPRCGDKDYPLFIQTPFDMGRMQCPRCGLPAETADDNPHPYGPENLTEEGRKRWDERRAAHSAPACRHERSATIQDGRAMCLDCGAAL